MSAKFKQAIIYLGVITLVFSVSVAYAQPLRDVPERGIKHREKMMDNLTRELDLTPEQQGQIKKQRSEHRKKNRELKDEVSAKRLELKQELERQTTNKKRIDSIVAELKILMGNQLSQRVEGILSIREILTPEQFNKFQQRARSAGKNQRSRLRRRLKERKSRARRDFWE